MTKSGPKKSNCFLIIRIIWRVIKSLTRCEPSTRRKPTRLLSAFTISKAKQNAKWWLNLSKKGRSRDKKSSSPGLMLVRSRTCSRKFRTLRTIQVVKRRKSTTKSWASLREANHRKRSQHPSSLRICGAIRQCLCSKSSKTRMELHFQKRRS